VRQPEKWSRSANACANSTARGLKIRGKNHLSDCFVTTSGHFLGCQAAPIKIYLKRKKIQARRAPGLDLAFKLLQIEK
jgi:hypothetical protein